MELNGTLAKNFWELSKPLAFLDEFGHLHLHTLICIVTRQLSSPVQVKEEAGGGRHQD